MLERKENIDVLERKMLTEEGCNYNLVSRRFRMKVLDKMKSVVIFKRTVNR